MSLRKRLLTSFALVATVAATAAAPASAEPSANASCLGQFVFFLTRTSEPNLGLGAVMPAATSEAGAIGEFARANATQQPHTLHC